ncbi:MAG TPA: hypothetical protein VKA21_15630 [Candidatus Binatia bacterium]|nr:hypothetical protein [Candidatus Binatia bacterium]
MTRATGLLALLLLSSVAPALAAPTDGIWTLRERFCVTVNGKRQCGAGREQFMLLETVAWYRPAPDDAWTEIGTVVTSGSKLTIVVSREGVGRLIAARVGADVSDLLQNFVFTYSGRHRGSRIAFGRIRVSVDIATEETSYRIRGRGTFTGRRVGDAYPVPPPEPPGDLDLGALTALAAVVSGDAAR